LDEAPMPIEDHPLFEQPPDDAKLWRYMDVPKLVSILVSIILVSILDTGILILRQGGPI
jgi:hypothetical protein